MLSPDKPFHATGTKGQLPSIERDLSRRGDSRCEPVAPKARLHGADLFGETWSIHPDSLERGVKTRLDLCCVHRNPTSTQPSTHYDDGDDEHHHDGDGDGCEKVHLAEERFRRSGWDTASLSAPGAG
jgi:hypothetical protein